MLLLLFLLFLNGVNSYIEEDTYIYYYNSVSNKTNYLSIGGDNLVNEWNFNDLCNYTKISFININFQNSISYIFTKDDWNWRYEPYEIRLLYNNLISEKIECFKDKIKKFGKEHPLKREFKYESINYDIIIVFSICYFFIFIQICYCRIKEEIRKPQYFETNLIDLEV
jgi:hypothetical protein